MLSNLSSEPEEVGGTEVDVWSAQTQSTGGLIRQNCLELSQGPSFFTVSRVREIGCFWGNPVKSTVDP